MEVPRLGVETELQLQVYTTATATSDLSCICGPHCSLQQRQIYNPLSMARDRTCILTDLIAIKIILIIIIIKAITILTIIIKDIITTIIIITLIIIKIIIMLLEDQNHELQQEY